MPTYIGEKDAIISVTLAGVRFPTTIKSWKTFEGGDPAAASKQLNPGGSTKAIARPGVVTTSNVTVTLPYSVEVNALKPAIRAAVNGAMSVSATPIDGDGNPNGATDTYTGLFRQPQFPKFDAGSSNDAMLGLVMECDTK